MDAFADGDPKTLHVIVETPKGSRNKYEYDAERGLFKLGGVLPAGAVFPFDFGFVPETLGGDGDPVDVLLLMDEPAFTGCRVEARLVGGVAAEQTERDGETTRNDRLVAVAAESRTHRKVRSLATLGESVVEEIEHFFVSYNDIKGKSFRPLSRGGPARALELIEEGIRRFRTERKRSDVRKRGGTKKRRGGAKQGAKKKGARATS